MSVRGTRHCSVYAGTAASTHQYTIHVSGGIYWGAAWVGCI